MQESKLLLKLASYSRWCAPPPAGPAAPPAAAASAPSPAPPLGGAEGAQGRSDRLAALQASVSFVSALNNTDADGRIFRTPAQAAGASAPSSPRHDAGTGGDSSGQLKYVLLSAATHFGRVLARCRAVVLASGTLAPVEALAEQLFAGAGLRWAAPPPPQPPTQQPPPQQPHEGPAAPQPCIAVAAAPVDWTGAAYRPARLLGVLKRGGGSPPLQLPGGGAAPCCAAASHGGGGGGGGRGSPAGGQAADGSATVRLATGKAAAAEQEWEEEEEQGALRPLVHFACGHVVPHERVSVLVAGTGPSGAALDLRFSTRSTPAVMDEVRARDCVHLAPRAPSSDWACAACSIDARCPHRRDKRPPVCVSARVSRPSRGVAWRAQVGRLLLNVCRVVPGGVVAFAPSFQYLRQLWQRWQDTGALDALRQR